VLLHLFVDLLYPVIKGAAAEIAEFEVRTKDCRRRLHGVRTGVWLFEIADVLLASQVFLHPLQCLRLTARIQQCPTVLLFINAQPGELWNLVKLFSNIRLFADKVIRSRRRRWCFGRAYFFHELYERSIRLGYVFVIFTKEFFQVIKGMRRNCGDIYSLCPA
jgi:hypothetical protein